MLVFSEALDRALELLPPDEVPLDIPPVRVKLLPFAEIFALEADFKLNQARKGVSPSEKIEMPDMTGTG